MSVKPGRLHLLHAAYATPWAMRADKIDEVFEFLSLRAAGHTLSKRELARRGFSTVAARPGTLEASSGGRVAVLPLQGVIAHHAGFEMQISGGTSTVAFGDAFDAAINDPNVSAIVIDCDSPGGTVEGVAELFEKVYAARGKKPIKAVANANCHSAAYWIASAADEIIVTKSGSIGNIGVMTVRTDTSELEAKEGIKRTLIKAGKHKGEGAPFEPMSDEEYAATLERVEGMYAMFTADVAKGRGAKVADVRSGYGEGRSVSAREAVAMGLADRVATLADVLGEFGASAPKKSAARGMTALAALNAETCPNGHEMEDGADACPECDDEDTDAENALAARKIVTAALSAIPELSPVASAENTPSTLTALAGQPIAASPVALHPSTTETITMTPEEKEVALKALRDAETARVSAIRALCADHGMSLKADSYITAGYDENKVRALILEEKKTVTAATRVPVVSSMVQRSEQDKAKGFHNPREFMVAVMQNGDIKDPSDVSDERLKPLALTDTGDKSTKNLAFALPDSFAPAQYRAAVGSDEQGGYADRYGHFLVGPNAVIPGLLQRGFEGDPTSGRTMSVPMATPSITLNARTDNDHTTSVAGGLTVTRRPETVAPGSSRMSTEQIELKATTLMALAYVTEELLQDSPISFAALLDAGFRDQFGAHILNEKIRGVGGNEYQGVVGAPGTISIVKESGQAADTIVSKNVIKMAARAWNFGNSFWIANHDTRPQLAELQIVTGTGGVLLYQPAKDVGFPDMLWGRPVVYSEFASTIGDAGDLILGDWSQYLEGTYQPLQSASSVHVRFVNHEQTFKLWTRNAGAPWWRAALTPAKSTSTLAPFITLAARA